MAEVIKSSGNPQFFLPDEIIGDILSRLPPRSIARLRSVCKQWCSLTYDPSFLVLQCNRARVLHEPIILSRFVDNQITFFDKAENKIIPRVSGINLRRCLLSNSVNGLTCAFNFRGTEVHLLNPTTRELVKLPNPRFEKSTYPGPNLGIGFDVTTGKYKVVRLFSQFSRIPFGCEVLTLGDQNWRYVEETPFLDVYVPYFLPVFLHGALHWFVISRHGHEEHLKPLRHILTFDIKEEKYGSVIPLPKTSSFDEYVDGDLMELRGNLHVGLHSGNMHHLEIWMLGDYTNHGWTKMYSFHGDTFSSLGLWMHYIIDISNEKIIFCGEFNINIFSIAICCYDMHEKTSRELCLSDDVGLILDHHVESLISPRTLLGNLSVIATK